MSGLSEIGSNIGGYYSFALDIWWTWGLSIAHGLFGWARVGVNV
jgi:hypothetical protein